MNLYRRTPGPLPVAIFGDCLLLGDAATMLLIDSLHGAGDGAAVAGQSPALAAHRAEIDQATGMLTVHATGMLTVQLGDVTAAEAFARLRAYAYAQDRALADVAADIDARRLRLHPDPAT